MFIECELTVIQPLLSSRTVVGAPYRGHPPPARLEPNNAMTEGYKAPTIRFFVSIAPRVTQPGDLARV